MLPSHVHGKIWPNSTQFSFGLFFFPFGNLFWDTLCRLLHKANFQNGNSSFRDFCCRMNPILRVASRDLEAAVDYGNVISSCRLAHSESGKSFNFYKMESFYLDHLSKITTGGEVF